MAAYLMKGYDRKGDQVAFGVVRSDPERLEEAKEHFKRTQWRDFGYSLQLVEAVKLD